MFEDNILEYALAIEVHFLRFGIREAADACVCSSIWTWGKVFCCQINFNAMSFLIFLSHLFYLIWYK